MIKALCELYAQVGAKVTTFVLSPRGVSTIEYALITIAVIGIVGAAVAALGGAFSGLFDTLSDDLDSARSAAATAGGT